MEIMRRIDNMRVKKGWTFYRLSQESGLSQQTFTKWAKGNTSPSVKAIEKICNAFGITVANFFAEDNMIEVTPETKFVFDNWNLLTEDEKASIKFIIENYVRNKN